MVGSMVGPQRHDSARPLAIRHVLDFHAKLHGKSVFSKIDLLRAFHQIPVADKDVPKTAVTTPFGLFELPVMNFGLRNGSNGSWTG